MPLTPAIEEVTFGEGSVAVLDPGFPDATDPMNGVCRCTGCPCGCEKCDDKADLNDGMHDVNDASAGGYFLRMELGDTAA